MSTDLNEGRKGTLRMNRGGEYQAVRNRKYKDQEEAAGKGVGLECLNSKGPCG